MKVLLVSPLPPPMGGIATLTKRMIEYFSSSDININCINVARSANYNNLDIIKNSKAEALFIMLRTIIYVLFNCITKQCDIIHINSSSGDGSIRDYCIERIARLFNIPVILQYHCNLEFAVNNSKIAVFLLEKCIGIASQTIVLNKASYEFLNRRGLNAIIVPNGIPKKMIATKHTINKDIKKVIFTGRVSKAKGCLELYECAKAYPNVKFYLAGLIDESIGKMMERLDNIVLLGSVSHDEVIEELDDSDLFLFPTYTEGFSMSLLEAMARGVPCITTNVGANIEMLEEKGGIVVEPKDSQAIIKAFEQIVSFDLRDAMSKWNIYKVNKHYTEDIMFETITNVYNDVIISN